ncbi:hypothetical protein GSI_12660 [Ganoderma sinense ZZ0214-1]|uniref:F-box domain-containing protein n=1 Tax=Ganoderma sinense ZZ0214-1 TaxID=1077348 RepID=A0A2G8RTG7_9APHY|nr:hypothetical protein GSI_12660 [Ganoderma sinense ZZ0214-1]
MTPVFQLQDLPGDVLFHIFTFLDIRDIVYLRKTCKALEDLTRDRSVWHDVLSTRFLQKGLPIPGIKDRCVSSLSAAGLERVTIRASRYWSNWISPQPQCYFSLEIRPTARPWTSIPSHRNLAAEFLPWMDGRYLLTLTLYTTSSDRESRRFSFQCWDLAQTQTQGAPTEIAELLVSGLLSYAVNTSPDSPNVLAITLRGGNHTYMATTYTIEFTTPDTEPWFRRTGQFPSTRRILGLEGSRLVSTDESNIVRVANIESGTWMCALKVPLIHADPTLRLPEQQCLGYHIFGDFIVTFCKQWIYLYHIPDSLASLPLHTDDHTLAAPSPLLDPIAEYKWRWRIDSITVNPRRPHPSSRSFSHSDHTPPAIDLLIRFDTWFPWPVNILHHYVLPPNPTFSRSSFSPTARSTFPYLRSPAPADGPLMAHAIPSPLRLFTPSDMVLGAYGTALWLDASTDAATPSQAGDRGQRIAMRFLAPSPAAVLQAGEGLQDDQVSPGMTVDAALTDALGAMALDEQSEVRMREWEHGVSVLHSQETHELWNRVAVNEEEGQVAVGYTDGRVSVYVYAPPEAEK